MSTDAEKERQLQLAMAFDNVRDSLDDDDDPLPMFQSIAKLLKDTFEAEACAIMLMSETSEEVESISNIGVPDDIAINLCRQAIQYESPTALETKLWPHTLGAQIALKGLHPLGGFFVARKSQAFNDADVRLFKLAENQIDSAIIQARTVWKLAERNRELEAIYHIDRLRDDMVDEETLISNFTNILIEQFEAELCMIIISHIDSGDFIVRDMVDKQDIPKAALESIRELTGDIRMPQVIPTPSGISGLMLLAAPFIVSGERLGAVVIGRGSVFSIADHRLLFAMTSQMDSAVAHSRMSQQLAYRNKELEVIYRIDHIRDKEHDFDTMLQHVLTELCRAVSSEMGYLMLYTEEREEQLELKAETKEGQLTSPDFYKVISRLSREALDTSELVYSNEPKGPIRSIVAVPLILNKRIIGVFGALNSSNPRGFSAENRRMLKAITSQVDTAVFERLERRRMRRVLSRSVDPKVLDALLQRADDSILHGERVVLTLMFADLRGSTEWAERTDPEEFVTVLNTFLASMTAVIFKHGGTLDKFVGDEIISLFGSPVPMGDHVFHAASAALEMQATHKQLQADFKAQGKELPSMGIGVSSGEVVAGEFGPPIRTDFTAMGRVMNLGSRLCSAAEKEQIIISQATYEMLESRVVVKTLDPITPKGISQPVSVYELLEIKS